MGPAEAPRNSLGDRTSAQLRGMSPTLVIPLGSTEQHGPHLPLDTDTRIATAVAGEVAQQLGYLLAPPIHYGASGEHQGFPGTISLGTSVLTAVLIEYGRSAGEWAQRMVFVNGHGGNLEALRAAAGVLLREGRDVTWCVCSVAGGDAHAGHTETSVLLHLSPAYVRSGDAVPGSSESLAALMPRMRRGGDAAVSDSGVLGDPTTATADAGARLFAQMVADCLSRVTRWEPDGDGMLR